MPYDSIARIAKRHQSRVRLWLLGLMLTAGSFPVEARLSVLTVMIEQHPAHEEVMASVRAELGSALNRRITVRIISRKEFAEGNVRGLTKLPDDLVMTLGSEAADTVLRANPSRPVLCGLLTRAVYRAAIPVNDPTGRRSAIFLDQPYSRQIQLVRQIMPGLTRLGVVLGPEGRRDELLIRRAAGTLDLRVERIQDEQQLTSTLHRVMDVSDALLVVPDAKVFNQHTAQNVLLTAYRRGRPVFAYSRAYATAGALAAVYTTPAQIGRQLADILLDYEASSSRRLPSPFYSRLFDVEINERVARSLGIETRNGAELARRIAEKANGDELP